MVDTLALDLLVIELLPNILLPRAPKYNFLFDQFTNYFVSVIALHCLDFLFTVSVSTFEGNNYAISELQKKSLCTDTCDCDILLYLPLS